MTCVKMVPRIRINKSLKKQYYSKANVKKWKLVHFWNKTLSNGTYLWAMSGLFHHQLI